MAVLRHGGDGRMGIFVLDSWQDREEHAGGSRDRDIDNYQEASLQCDSEADDLEFVLLHAMMRDCGNLRSSSLSVSSDFSVLVRSFVLHLRNHERLLGLYETNGCITCAAI